MLFIFDNHEKYSKITEKLQQRELVGALRKLSLPNQFIDFASNDYLGFFRKTKVFFDEVHQLLLNRKIKINGATGSRLLSGNHKLYQETEDFASFHNQKPR
jgi:8-amino-7-oxononanoate synthase